jgi:CRP/FNR family transcriptional regulator
MPTTPTFGITAKPLEDPLAFLPCSHILEYQKNQAIYSPERPCVNLYLIIAGKVMVRRMIADGERQLLVDIYVVDEFFGDWPLTDSIDSYEKAIAVEQNTRVMTWTDTEIEQLILRRPQLGIALIQMLTRRCIDNSRRIESFSSDNIARRLARSLIHFSERLGEKLENGSIQLMPLSHELLAEYVGTSREFVTQYMNQFRRQGFLRYSRKGIVVYPVAMNAILSSRD